MTTVQGKNSRATVSDTGTPATGTGRSTPFDTANVPGSQPSVVSGLQDEKTRARARVGRTVNAKWRLDALLGVGGMASVYAATYRNGSRAALKILHAEFARDLGIRERFLREGYV